MKTVGDLLKNAREQRGVSLEKIAAYTKINIKYLTAIENNDFQHLPPAAFTKGFLHTYASLVGVNAETVLAIFRRDYDQDDRGNIVLRNLIHPVKPPRFGITPTMLTTGFSILIGLIVLIFFGFQVIQYSAAPPLAMNEPAEGIITTSPVMVKGSTSNQATVMINNRSAMVEPSGAYAVELQLSPGEHTIVVIATSRSGKKTTKERTIYIQ
jgi:cytoskeletal protein RodZ